MWSREDGNSYFASLIPLAIIGAKRFYTILVAILGKSLLLQQPFFFIYCPSIVQLTYTIPLRNQLSSATGRLYLQLSFSLNTSSSARLTLTLTESKIGINQVNYQLASQPYSLSLVGLRS